MRTGKYSFTKKHCIRLRIHMADQCTEFDVSIEALAVVEILHGV